MWHYHHDAFSRLWINLHAVVAAALATVDVADTDVDGAAHDDAAALAVAAAAADAAGDVAAVAVAAAAVGIAVVAGFAASIVASAPALMTLSESAWHMTYNWCYTFIFYIWRQPDPAADEACADPEAAAAAATAVLDLLEHAVVVAA